ncbi:Crbn [Scenedesmus sp. PABB004]|nr:Crbn [Scenedesmus sp. PABB004]
MAARGQPGAGAPAAAAGAAAADAGSDAEGWRDSDSEGAVDGEPLDEVPPALQPQQQQHAARRRRRGPLARRISVALRARAHALLQHLHAAGDGDGELQGAVAALLADAAAGAASSDGEGGSEGASEGDDDAAAEPPGCTRFDPDLTASHAYLGDVDELSGAGAGGWLPAGASARLPLLVLDGVVLFPGCQLPLLLGTPHEQRLLSAALAAPPPLTRLLAVMPWLRGALPAAPRQVCCTAEVRQMRQHGGEGLIAVVALGRQRAELVEAPHEVLGRGRSQSSAVVRILHEGCETDVPPPLRLGAGAFDPALTRPWDLRLLVLRVREALRAVLIPPSVAIYEGTPLEFSFWVSSQLPLPPSTRAALLAAPCASHRLRSLLGLLTRLDQLACGGCAAPLAGTGDALGMTAGGGIAGTFVNAHGYVHELVTLCRVAPGSVMLEGRPETAHSWFPGFAWTIAHCGACGAHLGWRFTAARAGLSPRAFWGLRRAALVCTTRAGGDEQGGGGGDEQGGGGGDEQGGGGAGMVIQLGELLVPAGGDQGGRG